MSITPVYAGFLTLLYLILSFRVIAARRAQGVGLGDGGNNDVLRRIRAHGNFAEYVPLTLLLMAFAELQSQSIWIVHTMGALLIAGRSLHAIGVSRGFGNLRVAGMFLTFCALIAGALVNLGFSQLGDVLTL